MGGYIKLYRDVRGTAIAHNPEYLAAWVHLLCMATHTRHEQVVGTQVVSLEPGQLVFGRQKFSANTGISESKVRSALKVMQQLGMITSKSHSKFSVITITNWSKWQAGSPADDQQATSRRPAGDHKQEGSKKGSKMDEDTGECEQAERVPYQKILNLYHEVLPELPNMMNLDPKRKQQIKARWNETVTVPSEDGPQKVKCSTMDFWERFFERVRKQPFLMGESPSGWQPNLEWLTKKANFYKVIDGNFLP